MGITSKIVFGFLGIIVGFFLITLTFFYPASDEVIEFQVPEGFGNLETIQISGTGGVNMYPLSPYDSIYSDSEEFRISEGNIIEIETGQFLIDLHDITTPYTLKHIYFDIEFIGFGTVFIDTTNPTQYKILSLNNTLGVNLKDGTEEGSIATKLYLYPHMFLDFNPTRNRFLKNADLVRISSVYSLEYFPNPILYGDIPDVFGEKFQDIVAYKKEDAVKKSTQFNKIQSLKSSTFPGSDMIDTYFDIFVNESKKDIYYKNKAFNKIVTLSKTDKRDTERVEETLQAIENLKDKPEHYEDLQRVTSYFYKYILDSFEEDTLYQKLNFADLMNQLGGKDFSEEETLFISSFFIDSLYVTFDMTGKYSYNNLVLFYNTYIKELGIDIKKKTGYQETSRGYLEYLGFLIENIIVSRFSGTEDSIADSDLLAEDNLNDILEVMNGYITLNDIVYSSGGESKAITLIYQYINILQSINTFIRNGFFKTERSADGLLERRGEVTISSRTLTLLKSNIEGVLGFYRSNSKFLDTNKQRDVFIIETYASLLETFPEYLLALENYDSYFYTYNQAKKDLLNLNTGSQGAEEILSEENFKKYISGFKFLSLGSIKLTVNEQFYSVTGIFVSGKELSFDLYPFSDNKIDNIYINNKKVNSSYKLDVIQEQWKEISRGSSGKEKEKYDFSRFFINTFFTSTDDTREIFEIDTQVKTEDKVVVVFKRDRLLGTKGEFSDISKILQIEFDDLDVVAETDNYSISIHDADLSIDAKNQSGKVFDFRSEFDSDYILTDSKHEFRNIELTPYKISSREKKYALGNNIIDVIGSIQLPDFDSQVQYIGDSFSAINYIYDFVNREFSVDKLSIKYAVFSKKTTIKFDYQGKDITIVLLGNTIEKVTYGGTVLSNKDVSYRDIASILKSELNN